MKSILKDQELTNFVIDDVVYYAAPLEGYDRYWATTCGYIISCRGLDPIVLQGKETHNGYRTVGINTTPVEKPKDLRVHRLIAATFYDYDPLDRDGNQRLEVNHLNGIRDDNKAANLEWCSHEENIYHYLSVTKVLQKLAKEEI